MSRSVHNTVIANNMAALQRYLIERNQTDKLPKIIQSLEPTTANANGRICLEINSRNIRRIAEIVNDPCLGLELIASQQINKLSMLDFIDDQFGQFHRQLTHHPLMIIRLLERYFKVVTEVADLQCSINTQNYELTVAPYSTIVSHHQTDGVLIAVHRLLSSLSAEKPHTLKLMQSGSPALAKRYHQHFGITPEFNCPINSLGYASNNQYIAEADDYLRMLSLHERALHEQFSHINFSDRCRGLIRLLLTLGEPRRTHLCKIFSISTATLKRRLQHDGTSYSEILLDVRQSLARHYVGKDALSVTETALLLGYNDVHQFSKAFKRWFGMPPSQYVN